VNTAVHHVFRGRESTMRSHRSRIGIVPATLAALAVLASGSQLQAQERGYLGINLQCQNCERQDQEEAAVWWFSEYPLISWVREDGPAARAGLREGDVILSVAGIDLTTEEGRRDRRRKLLVRNTP
jgi:S1-C subfamily serine protease